MAMKKAEMEAHAAQYKKIAAEAESERQHGRYASAIRKALETFPHVYGMMQYRRKYKDVEFESVTTIDLVLELAPLIFELDSLAKVEALLNEYRQIDRNTQDSLKDKLTQAKARMHKAHQLWNHLEQHGAIREDRIHQALGGSASEWRSLAKDWCSMDLLSRIPNGHFYEISLATRMGQLTDARCSNCGDRTTAPKAMLLEPLTCPECNSENLFTMLVTD